jgi:hypothetical protein
MKILKQVILTSTLFNLNSITCGQMGLVLSYQLTSKFSCFPPLILEEKNPHSFKAAPMQELPKIADLFYRNGKAEIRLNQEGSSIFDKITDRRISLNILTFEEVWTSLSSMKGVPDQLVKDISINLLFGRTVTYNITNGSISLNQLQNLPEQSASYNIGEIFYRDRRIEIKISQGPFTLTIKALLQVDLYGVIL